MREILFIKDLPDRTTYTDRKRVRKKALYLCHCGKEFESYKDNIRNNHATSCGCIKRMTAGDRTRKHMLTGTKEFTIWAGMRGRCYNPNNDRYNNYGGRGITVCERWRDKKDGFINFLADMGKSPYAYTLDRIDVNGNYCKENCRWADQLTQQNNRRNNHYVEYKGITKTVSQWAVEYGFKPDQIIRRLLNGWSIEESLNTPMRKITKR